MVDPRRSARVFLMGMAAIAPGCAVVPRTELEECHQLCRSLQAETSQLKDTALRLRSQNEDLTQRAVADTRRLGELEEDNRGLRRDVAAYRDEREQLVAAFERLKQQVVASIDSDPTAMLDEVRTPAEVASGPETPPLTIPASRLFLAGSDRWTPDADILLREAASRIATGGHSSVEVAGIGARSAVLRTSAGAPPDGPGELPGARARRVAERLRTLLPSATVEVSGRDGPLEGPDGRADREDSEGRIVIAIRPGSGASPEVAGAGRGADPR
jgi:hypothetical protein